MNKNDFASTADFTFVELLLEQPVVSLWISLKLFELMYMKKICDGMEQSFENWYQSIYILMKKMNC